MNPAIERKLTTILAADVAGYSRLMEADEEQTLWTFQAHKSIFESLVASHGGRVFNTAGDAILAEFGSPLKRSAARQISRPRYRLETNNWLRIAN